MYPKAKKNFWGFLIIVLTSGTVFGQFSNTQDFLKIDKNIIEMESAHPGVPDTLVSKLSFDIHVYIEKENKRMGASPRKDGNDKHLSKMKKGKGIALDSKRLRGKKPVTLILMVPSKEENGNFQLRGVQTNFNEHLHPTRTRVLILDDSKGIEVHYHFDDGIEDLPEDHEHFHDIEIMRHFTGHICDPTRPDC